MKRSGLVFIVFYLLAIPVLSQVMKKPLPVIKPGIQVLKPTSASTWWTGKTITVRWRTLFADKAGIDIILVKAMNRFPDPHAGSITLASGLFDSGSWRGTLAVALTGRYRVCVRKGKASGCSDTFDIMAKAPQPDLTCSIDRVRFSTSPEGDFMGHDIDTSVTNLNHSTAAIAASSTIWMRIESQANPAKYFDHQLLSYEVQELHNNGSVQITWNMALDMDMPQPWKLTVDSKNNITESNEGNNTDIGP